MTERSTSYWLVPPLLGLELLPAPLPDDEPPFWRWVELEPLPDVLPAPLPLLGLSIRWLLPLVLPLPVALPLPLVPRSHAATPSTKVETNTAVNTRYLVIVTLLVDDIEKTLHTLKKPDHLHRLFQNRRDRNPVSYRCGGGGELGRWVTNQSRAVANKNGHTM